MLIRYAIIYQTLITHQGLVVGIVTVGIGTAPPKCVSTEVVTIHNVELSSTLDTSVGMELISHLRSQAR